MATLPGPPLRTIHLGSKSGGESFALEGDEVRPPRRCARDERRGSCLHEHDTHTPAAAAAIAVEGLTKRYGDVTAVDDLSFTVRRGAVTGFLGPNGAGKTTALKAIVGLSPPDRRPCAHQRHADRLGGARRAHARCLHRVVRRPSGPLGARSPALARGTGGLPRGRVDEVLAIVGLEHAAGRRVGKYSTGMRQRLGLASALLGDPEILVLDEPLNGLDPQGIRWLRTLLRERGGRRDRPALEPRPDRGRRRRSMTSS